MKNRKNVLSVRLFGVAAIALAIVVSMAGCKNPTDPGSNGKSLASIAVTTPPTKTTHNIGDELDTAGIVVTATYSDGSTEEVTGYTFSGYDKDTAGEQTVTVKYQGKTATFTVTVVDPSSPNATLTGIAVTTQPTTTQYYTGETLNTAGMVVTATYSDGSTAAVTDYTTNPANGFTFATAGEQTVTVTYQTKTTTFKVTVTARSIVATPTATPAGGTLVAIGTPITLATATSGADIWYTTNGSAPAKSGDGSTKYTAPFAITTLPTTVKAIAVKDEWSDSAVLTAEYGSARITVADISITAPAKGATPATTVSNQEQEHFSSGTVSWEPNVSVFEGSTVYKATVTLKAKEGYTFAGINTANVKVNGKAATTVIPNITGTPGATITVSYTFPATTDKVVSAIAIKSQPSKLTYSHGDALDLTGMEVTLTYSDGQTEDVAAANFSTNGVTASPAHGIPLEHSTYNGKPVTITYGNLPAQSTGALTVNAINVSALTIDAIPAQTYTGTPITPAITVKYPVSTGTARDLVLGTDYTVAYTDNVNAGTAKVTITGAKDYTGTRDVTFTINKANPVTTWPTASDINYGQALSDSALSGGQAAAGTFAWDAPDTKPDVGTHAYKVTFTPNDTVNYETVSKNDVSITVNAAHITVADITITAPTKGAAPAATVSNLEQEHFTSETVTWSPDDSAFKPSVVYTATVTLKAKQGYTFTGINEANVKVNDQAATSVTIDDNDDTLLTLTYKFPATGEKAVSSFAIKTQPTNLNYTHGDALDLSGLMVTLTYDDGTTADIAAANFSTNGVTASPSNGTPLEYSTYNGKPVTITIGSLTKDTSNLTINQGNASTFTVEPASIAAQPYTGSAITPAITVKYPVPSGTARELMKDTDYTAAYTNNTNAGQATITISGKGDYTGTKAVNFTINAKSILDSGVTISGGTAAQTYTGSEIKPTVTVSFGSATLASGTDYTVAYENNTNAGQATVTITGKGNFNNSTTVHFTINKATPVITGLTAAPITYGALLSTSVISGNTGGVLGTFTWDAAPDFKPTVGSFQYDVTFTPNDTNNYNVVAAGKLSITVNKINLSGFTVELTITDYQYTGSAITPAVTVKDGATTLTQTTDFTVSCTNNTTVGTATLTINGAGNYTGSITGKTFNIIKANPVITTWPSAATITYGAALSTSNLTGGSSTPAGTFAWTDGTITPTVTNSGYSVTFTPTDTGNYNTATGTVSITVNPKNASGLTIDPITAVIYTGTAFTPTVTVKDGEKTLTLTTDYTVAYGENINVATGGSVTITGKGNYTGDKGATFTISPKNASTLTIEAIAAQTYTGSEIKPEITVKDGTKTLTLTTDYTVVYGENIKVATGGSVIITGAGNYTGTKDATFTINPKAVSGLTIDAIAAQTYTGSEIKPEITVKDGTKTLALTTDYTVAYGENIKVATGGSVIITGVGNYKDTKTATFTISKATGGTVSAPTAVSAKTPTSITINAVSVSGNTEQTVEYACTTSTTAPQNGWQNETTFTGLTPATTYYIFARTKESANYNTGTPSTALAVTTPQSVAANKFVYYWADDLGNLSTSASAVTANTNEPVTITAQGQSGDYSGIQWYVDGKLLAGETGASYTFSSAKVGNHTIGLFVQKGGKYYNTNIVITVK